MFTGIIRHLGTIAHAEGDSTERYLTIKADLARDLSPGDSVAVNGACLTVLRATETAWEARLMAETLRRTNLGNLRSGDFVNLERPLRAGQPLDGHFVLGHVDGQATVVSITPAGADRIFTFEIESSLTPYLVPKGSVALDGVSLTVVELSGHRFTVSMMPYTLEHTTFGRVGEGYRANIETDVLGKYAARLLARYRDSR